VPASLVISGLLPLNGAKGSRVSLSFTSSSTLKSPLVTNVADAAIFLPHGFEARGKIVPLALDVGKTFSSS